MKEFTPTTESPKEGLNQRPQNYSKRKFDSDRIKKTGHELDNPVETSHEFNRIPVFNQSALPVQPKLKINAPGDHYEKEADRMADQVMRMPQPTLQRKCSKCGKEEEHIQRKPLLDQISPLLQRMPFDNVQRKCAKCEEEEEKGTIQTKRDGGGSLSAGPEFSNEIRKTKGQGNSMDAGTQTFMESRFGADFSSVRIHKDRKAAEMNQQINARAFTLGQDIYFNQGQYQTNSTQGKKLLAHELTHTLQQSGGMIQRMEAPVAEQANATAQTSGFLVEDDVNPVGGQMRKSSFLELLNREVCATVDQELQGTPHSSDNCPYIRAIFSRHRNSSAGRLQQLIARYQNGTAGAQSASEVIQLILQRVRIAVNSWKQRGELSDVPENISGLVSAMMESPGNGGTGGESSDSGAVGIFFKANSGGAVSPDSPASVMNSLGEGQQLNGGIRSKMEGAFGASFSNVKIHTDIQAASLSKNMNAKAFAVGNHIAFGQGEYQPGTLAGDALIAHELAHVAQQGSAVSSSTPSPGSAGYASLEEDADKSAMSAMMSTWTGLKQGLKTFGSKAMPRLRSGLRLQRCPDENAPERTVRYRKYGGTGFDDACPAYCACKANFPISYKRHQTSRSRHNGQCPPGIELVLKGSRILSERSLHEEPCGFAETVGCL